MKTQTKPITVEDLRALEARGVTREVINGRWVDGENDVAAGKRHGKLGARLITRLSVYVETRDLGVVYQNNTTYILEGDDQDIIEVQHPDDRAMTYGADETLTGGELLPDFTLDIDELFG